MFHPNTQRMIDDWTRRCGDRPAPLRTDFSPAALGGLMPQLFMLDGASGEDDFRLVGGLIFDLHARDLRGVPFRELWARADMLKATAALSEVRATLAPIVVSARAHTAQGYETRIEIALAPLLGTDGTVERVLGLYQPTSSLARLLGKPVEALSFRALQPAGASEALWSPVAAPQRPARADLRVVAIDGRRVA
jgi:hypothetical protein